MTANKGKDEHLSVGKEGRGEDELKKKKLGVKERVAAVEKPLKRFKQKGAFHQPKTKPPSPKPTQGKKRSA